MTGSNPYESPGTANVQPQGQFMFPAWMALHMGTVAAGFSCFTSTRSPGGRLFFPEFEFSTQRFFGAALIGVLIGYFAGSMIKCAMLKWPSIFDLKIPERKRKRTRVAYLLVPCAIGLWHVYNLNWFGMLCLHAMGGFAALMVIECSRLGGLKTR